MRPLRLNPLEFLLITNYFVKNTSSYSAKRLFDIGHICSEADNTKIDKTQCKALRFRYQDFILFFLYRDLPARSQRPLVVHIFQPRPANPSN